MLSGKDIGREKAQSGDASRTKSLTVLYHTAEPPLTIVAPSEPPPTNVAPTEVSTTEFITFLKHFLTQEQYVKIVNKSKMSVANAKENPATIPGEISRIFNDYPFKDQKYCALTPGWMETWTQTCSGLITAGIQCASASAQYKTGIVSLKQREVKVGEQKKVEEKDDKSKKEKIKNILQSIKVKLNPPTVKKEIRFTDIKEGVIHEEAKKCMDQFIAEARKQILNNDDEIDKEIIKLFNLDSLLDTKEKRDLVKLQLIISFIGQIILANIVGNLNEKAKGLEPEQKSSFEQLTGPFHAYCLAFIFNEHVEQDKLGNEIIVNRLTDYFLSKVMGTKVLSDKKLAAMSARDVQLAAGFDEDVPVPVENPSPSKLISSPTQVAELKKQSSQLSKRLFVSFVEDKYPLEDVPKKFRLEKYAAVTFEDRLHLIKMIILDATTKYSMKEVLEFFAQLQISIADSIKVIEKQDNKIKLAAMERRKVSVAHLRSEFDKLFDKHAAKIEEKSKLKSSTTTSAEEQKTPDVKVNIKTEMMRIIKAFNDAIPTSSPQRIEWRLFGIDARQIAIKRIRDLPYEVEDIKEFVAILKAEHAAHFDTELAKPFCVAYAEIVEESAKKDSVFADMDQKTDEENGHIFLFGSAVKLLKYVAELEKVTFFYQEMDVQAARSIAHYLVKCSVKKDGKEDAAEYDKTKQSIYEIIDYVKQAEKLDTKLVAHLNLIMQQLRDPELKSSPAPYLHLLD